jgi:two-component sensor histidine kinase
MRAGRELAGADPSVSHRAFRLAESMKNFRFASLGSLWLKLALLFAIVLLPPTLLSGALAWNAFSDHTRRAILTVRQFTVLAATYERRFFEDTRKRLQRLANDPALVSTDPSVCAAPLLHMLDAYPEFSDLIYYGPNGEQKCGTDSSLDNAAGLSWFRDVDMFRSFTISDYTFSSTAPRPVIVAALPVYDSPGRLNGILSASIDLTWLSAFLRDVRLPADGIFFLLDSSGNVLANSASLLSNATPALPKSKPDEPESNVLAPPAVGPGMLTSVVEPDLVDDVINRRLVDFEAIGKDDVRRVYSSVALPHGGVTLLSGVPADVAFGWVERDLVARILSLVAIWLAGIVAAWLGTRWLVTQWIAPLGKVAQAYGGGDYSTRIELDRAPNELRELGATMMRMAARIEAREGDLRTSLAQKDVLLREIHHRVKNNLQIVSSLLNVRSATPSAAGERQGLEEFKTRVRALALVHRHLYESADVQLVGLRPFLTELCNMLVRTLASNRQAICLDIDVPNLPVLSDRAVTVALLVTEVVTNSLKHAFPGERTGRISVRLTREGETACTLRIADNGIGFVPSERDETDDTAPGIGRQLIGAFARQLDGEMTVNGIGGTTVSIRFDRRVLSGDSPGPPEPF